MRTTLRVLACVSVLILGTLAVGHLRASDEYLATMAPITDLTTGTNAALTVDFNQYGPRQRWTLSGNITITTLANARSGVPYHILFKQDATGSRTVSWPSNVLWNGGSAPTITTTANKQDIIEIFWDEKNAKFLGFALAQNF